MRMFANLSRCYCCLFFALYRTILDALSSAQKYTKGSKRWKQLTEAVTKGIAKDTMPVYSVEKPGFRQMLAQFDRRYELPSRKYFSQVAIPALYAKVRDKVDNELLGLKYYSATTDLLSSKGLLPYISYTIHWVDDEWNYKTRCLEKIYLPSDHTAANIADALKDIRQTWKLPEEGQMAIATDNAANMICATNILKWQRLSCFGHNPSN